MQGYSAHVQSFDWNDLKYLLALYRSGTLKGAAGRVRASPTTVTRRIRALEVQLGAPLFLGSTEGRYTPTEAALRIMSLAETVERENSRIVETLAEQSPNITGCVRISTVPIIVNRLLVPNLGTLSARHPRLTVELLPAATNLDLFKRDADLAVRFARPTDGGLKTKAHRLGELRFGAFASRAISPDELETLGWITYPDILAQLPQARWLEAVTEDDRERQAQIKVGDADTALEAVACGLGKSLLPRAVALPDARVGPLSVERHDPPPAREVWLLSHADQAASPSVMAVKDWLAGLDWS